MIEVSSKTKALQDKRKKYIPRGVSHGNWQIAASARNATITDIDGKEWIDFAGAIGTLNVGHSHPKVTEAAKEQINHFIHPGFNIMLYEGYIALAEKLCEKTPGNFDKQALLLNSGAEAVENAVKISRRYTKRQAVVAFTRGFHGRTNMTMSMTSKVNPYKTGFGPFAPEVYQAPFPYLYQKPAQMTEEAYIQQTIQDFKDFFITTVDPYSVACVVMEPIQGEGGFIIPPESFVQFVSDFCKEYGIVFVADEIQTGFGRTGKLFAMEHFDVAPDLMTVSKSLAAGFPLSAVVGRKEILNASEPGELGGTYGGNPVACAAALAVFDIMEEENLLNKSERIGEQIEEELQELAHTNTCIGDIRRLGAMVAVEIVDHRETKQPDKERTQQIVSFANNHGLLLLSAGMKGNVIRFLTPLVITDDELKEGISIFKKAFQSET